MHDIDRLGIIGAGSMGVGFAVHFALHGFGVTLIDHRQSNLDAARAEVREVVDFLNDERLADTAPDTVLDQIRGTLDREAGVKDVDFVLETVSEDLALKQAIFESVAAATAEDVVLASNTSSLPIDRIAAAAGDAADRVIGCHWWNPPYLLRPVEVVQGERTAAATLDRTMALVEAVDRDPIVLDVAVPGFIWNRVQFAVVRECLHLAEAGVSSIDDINRAVRDGYARRTAVIGPFETMDIAGIDLFRTVAAELYPHLCSETEPHALLDDYVDEGRTGIETGAGFFDYARPGRAVKRDRDEQLAALSRLLDEGTAD